MSRSRKAAVQAVEEGYRRGLIWEDEYLELMALHRKEAAKEQETMRALLVLPVTLLLSALISHFGGLAMGAVSMIVGLAWLDYRIYRINRTYRSQTLSPDQPQETRDQKLGDS